MIVSKNCAYSWWCHPIATKEKGGDNLLFGGILSDGTPRCFTRKSWDCDCINIHREDFMPKFEPDDHNPVVTLSSGNYIVNFFSRHGKDHNIYYRVKDLEGNWLGSRQTLTYPDKVTYVQVVNYHNLAVLLVRVGSNQWHYRVSSDYGQTWSTNHVFFADPSITMSQQVYVTLAPTDNASVFAMAIYGHPTSSTWRDVLYGTLDLQALYAEVSGSTNPDYDLALGTPYNKTSLEVAYTPNPAKAGERVRLLDVGVKHGNPIVLVGKWNDNTQIPQYYLYHKTNGTWQNYKIRSSGGVFDDGGGRKYTYGMALDRNNKNYIYVAFRTHDTLYEIKRYTIQPDMTLADEKHIYHNSSVLARPYTPWYADGVLFQEFNYYRNYTDYKIEIRYAG